MIGALKTLHRSFARHPLTRDAPVAAWARFARWQIESRVRPVVRHRWVGGADLIVENGMNGATGNIYLGLHEFEDMAFTLHYLRPGDLFLDLGANVGTYTVLASRVRGARSFAFEPDPDSAAKFARNVAANDIGDLVTLHQCALGEADGEAAFSLGLGTGNQLVQADGAATRRVALRRLDGVLGDENPDMMKIDVEGGESGAIRGAAATLAKPSLNAILIETVEPDTERALAAAGFRRVYYAPKTRAITDTPSEDVTGNWLYVRDVDAASRRVRAAPAFEIFGNGF